MKQILFSISQFYPGDEVIDVLFYGSLNERRWHIIQPLKAMVLRLKPSILESSCAGRVERGFAIVTSAIK